MITLPPLPRLSHPPEGASVPECTVFQGADFGRDGGSAFRTTARVADVGDAFDGRIGSVVVHAGWWRFYIERDFAGRHIDLGAGDHVLTAEWRYRVYSFEPVAF